MLNKYVDELKKILSENYNKQKNFSGVINELYMLESHLRAGQCYSSDYFKDLVRKFVDETTHYDSPIVLCLENIRRECDNGNKRDEKHPFYIK